MASDVRLSAKDVIENILPDAEPRRIVMDRLLRSWKFASGIAPAAGSVTLREDGFRMNVGQVEALTFFDDTMRILLAASIEDRRLKSLPVSGTKYRSVRGPQCVFEGTAAEYQAVMPLIDPLHEEFIRGAATTINGVPRQGSPFVGHHSSELIGYAEECISTPTSRPVPALPFNIGSEYTRSDVFSILGIPDPRGGPWYTGYTSHGPDLFIFCGVGTTGRTGHDYNNHFLGDDLVWFAKGGTHLGQASIQQFLNPVGRVYVFYRENDRNPFTFAGVGSPVHVEDTTPVKIIWSLRSVNSNRQEHMLPEEVGDENELIIEGARKSVLVNIYERDPVARRKCIEHWGTNCGICDFDFATVYGDDLGKGFIHVHHLKPWTRAKLQPFDGLPKFWRKIGVGDERKRKLFIDISGREVFFIANDRAREFFDRLSKV
jgi:5-methylcytosine-specific restriction protein A